MTDGELVVAARYRWILAHDEPEIVGYDQDLWVERLGHRDDDVGRLVTLFESLRTANLELWSRMSPGDRARIGIHQERGAESIDLMFRLAAGHDRVHLAQAQRALALVTDRRARTG